MALPASVGPHASVMPRQNIWPIWPRLVGEVPQDITLENVLAMFAAMQRAQSDCVCGACRVNVTLILDRVLTPACWR